MTQINQRQQSMTCCELEIQFKAKFSFPKDIILLCYYFPNLFLFVVDVVHFTCLLNFLVISFLFFFSFQITLPSCKTKLKRMTDTQRQKTKGTSDQGKKIII